MVANKLYQPPGEASGRSKKKFWYLSPDSWPFNMIMKPEMETHRRRYLSRSS
jgi:hypothetical protein